MSTLKELAKQYGETVKTIKELEERKDELKKEILDAVGGGAFKNNFITVSITPPSSVESVDKEAMKADGIYEKYLTKSPRAGSEKITVKLDKIDEPDTIEVKKGEPALEEDSDMPY